MVVDTYLAGEDPKRSLVFTSMPSHVQTEIQLVQRVHSLGYRVKRTLLTVGWSVETISYTTSSETVSGHVASLNRTSSIYNVQYPHQSRHPGCWLWCVGVFPSLHNLAANTCTLSAITPTALHL